MKIFALMAAALVLPLAATAQERTAGQAYDAQTNWASLKGMFDKVDAQNKALAATITKMQVCADKGAFFRPADTDKDADGCAGGREALFAPAIRDKLIPTLPKAPDGKEWADKIVCPYGSDAAFVYSLEYYQGSGTKNVFYHTSDEMVFFDKTTGARTDSGGKGGYCPMNYKDAIKIYRK